MSKWIDAIDYNSNSEFRSALRDINVEATKKVLDRYGIKYKETNTENIVELINYKKTHMSLKRKNSMFKVRIDGKWGNYPKEKLLEMLSVKDMKKLRIKKK